MVFLWSLSDSKSPQVSRSQADFNKTVVIIIIIINDIFMLFNEK